MTTQQTKTKKQEQEKQGKFMEMAKLQDKSANNNNDPAKLHNQIKYHLSQSIINLCNRADPEPLSSQTF